MTFGRPRVILVCSTRLPHVVRYALAARDTGFDVGLLAPPGQPVSALDWVHIVGRFSQRRPGRSVARALNEFRSDLVVPLDDPAAAAVFAASGATSSGTTKELIEVSVGDPASFALRHDRKAISDLAMQFGLPSPASRCVKDADEVTRAVEELGLPVAVKIDGTYGGNGVEIVNDVKAARAAFTRLTSAFGAPEHATVQQFIEGQTASATAVAWKGQVLSQVSLRVLQTSAPYGSSTVVQPIENADMTRAVERIAEAVGLSGFFGLDFIIPPEGGRAYLLELNPRITATAYVWFGGRMPMLSLLAERLGLPVPALEEGPVPPGPVALFPQELARDPGSAYLRTVHCEVPRHAPDVVAFCHRWIRSRSVAEKVVRVGCGLIATSTPIVKTRARWTGWPAPIDPPSKILR